MIFVLDFDHTLFNTEKFKSGLARATGVSRAKFNESYKKMYNEKLRAVNYDLNQHLRLLSKFDEKIIKKLDEFFKTLDKFLKPGAVDLLENLKARKYSLLLLTAGNIGWQKRKIGNLKIKKYFDKIIYAGFDKPNSIKKLKKVNNKIILINDNSAECIKLKKTLGRNCQVFIIKGIYSRKKENKNFKYFYNLKQVNKFIIGNNL